MILSKVKSFVNTFSAKVLILLLLLMLLDYAGYGYYVFYLPLMYLFFHHRGLKIDSNFILLFIWGLSYSIIIYFNTGTISYVNNILPAINMPMLYLMGRYIALKNDNESILIIIYLFTISIATISILSIFKDIADKGFLVIGMERNVPLIGIENEEGWVAATGISSRLLPLLGFVSFLFCKIGITRKLLFTILPLIAFVCALRIQSRTSVVFFVAVIIVSFIYLWKNFRTSQKLSLIIIFSLFVIFAIRTLAFYSSELMVLERFQTDDYETGGGRTELLGEVASNMLDYPFGNMPSNIRYAHNLWFDCARVAGILPFILLVLLTYRYAKDLYLINRSRKISLLLKLSIIISSLAILTVCLLEPVLEGIPMIFAFFCLMYGIISILKYRI